jgi:hypothetical protein
MKMKDLHLPKLVSCIPVADTATSKQAEIQCFYFLAKYRFAIGFAKYRFAMFRFAKYRKPS